MNNRFTQKAQNTLNNALRFAGEMGHTYIGSEHILLALAAENGSVAANVLTAKGVSVARLKEEIASLVGLGSGSSVSPADMTPRTKRIIEGSAMESHRNGQSYIGTEHLLLAHLSEQNNFPDLAYDETASAIAGLGVNLKVASPIDVTMLTGDMTTPIQKEVQEVCV